MAPQTLSDEQVKGALVALDLLRGLLTAAPSVNPPVVQPPVNPPPKPTTFYAARTDRTVLQKPEPLTLGPAGFRFTDPIFGSRMLRATDAKTANGSPMRIPSNAHLAAWNTDGTKLFGMDGGGGAHFFSYDPSAMAVRSFTLNTYNSYLEPTFSFVDPNMLYGVSGPLRHTILRYNLLSDSRSTVLDLDAKYPALGIKSGSYVGGLLNVDNDTFACFFGGMGQDDHRYIHHSVAGLLDTLTLKPWPFKIHSIALDRTGQYVLIFPTEAAMNAAKAAGTSLAQVQVWDTVRNVVTPMNRLPGGHGTLGYGTYVNQDCCSGTRWDSGQWQFRRLTALDTTMDLIPTVRPAVDNDPDNNARYTDDHTNWRHCKPDVLMPAISTTYRFGTGHLAPWRAWEEEVIGVPTDGSGNVHRFGHHQSVVEAEFWDQPIINVSPNGRWGAFHSNWGRTVGAARQDIFIVELL